MAKIFVEYLNKYGSDWTKKVDEDIPEYTVISMGIIINLTEGIVITFGERYL